MVVTTWVTREVSVSAVLRSPGYQEATTMVGDVADLWEPGSQVHCYPVPMAAVPLCCSQEAIDTFRSLLPGSSTVKAESWILRHQSSFCSSCPLPGHLMVVYNVS